MSDLKEFERKRKNAELYGIDITKITKFGKNDTICGNKLNKKKKILMVNTYCDSVVEIKDLNLNFEVIDYSLKNPSIKLVVNNVVLEYFKDKWIELEKKFQMC